MESTWINKPHFVSIMSSLLTAFGPPQRFFIPWNGEMILSPELFIQGLSGIDFLHEKIQTHGPAMQLTKTRYHNEIEQYDLVPALVCLQPFPCIKHYLVRERPTLWPASKARAQIAAMPGVLVPTGGKGSPNIHTEWRYSFSVQEICLSQEMHGWVKAGYRAFKYTQIHLSRVLWISVYRYSTDEEVSYLDISVMRLIYRMTHSYIRYVAELEIQDWMSQRDLANKDESTFYSYHMKNYSVVVSRRSAHLEGEMFFSTIAPSPSNPGRLFNVWDIALYFNTHCNVFTDVTGREVALIRSCVVEILREAFAAMIHTAAKPNISKSTSDFRVFRKKCMLTKKKKHMLMAII